ncbi:MAG: hypothetical protein IRZ20_03860 [Thermoleophilia bacterium]|nr:hypothetical protein [Thermoleophilia bacterium]
MREAGLVSVYAKKREGSTTRAKEHPIAPDLVCRDFAVDAPDRLWVADFAQLTTWTGTCYIAVVADAYSRLCLGYSVRPDKSVELVLDALEMANGLRRPGDRLIAQSDSESVGCGWLRAATARALARGSAGARRRRGCVAASAPRAGGKERGPPGRTPW